MMNCKSCGALLQDGAMFCSDCGARQQEWPQNKPPKPITEPQSEAGSEQPTATLNPAPPAPEVAPITAEPILEAVPEQPTITPSPAPQRPNSGVTPPPQPQIEGKLLKNRKLGVAIAALLGVVILCEVLYFFVAADGMERIRSAMTAGGSKPAASESVPGGPVLPPSSAPPVAGQPSSLPAQGPVTPESPEPTPPVVTEAAFILGYEFTDWQPKFAQDWEKYQATSATFLPIEGAEELSAFADGVAQVKVNGKWGFITTPGGEVQNLLYDEVLPFVEGMAAVRIGSQWGYVNQDNLNKPAVCQWESTTSYKNGLAVVSKNGKEQAIDTQGNVVVGPNYQRIRAYGDGLFPVCAEGLWGYIDLEERVIIPFIYEDAGSFTGGLAVVVKDGETYYIDTTGDGRIGNFEDAWGFSENHTAKVKAGEKYGLINSDGAHLITPDWDNVWNLQEGVATVERDGKFGYVNQNNELVIEPIYSDVWSSAFGIIPVRVDNGNWGYLNQNGSFAIQPQYEDAYIFAEGVARVRQGGSYGLINLNNEPICNFNYKQMGYIREDYCPALTMDGVWGYLQIGYL